MSASNITRHFNKIGARVSVHPHNGRGANNGVTIDIRRDGAGEYFDIALGRDDVELTVMDVQPQLRHLLLMSRTSRLSKFLCGHDERHWFVAAVPEIAHASNVASAFEALKPPQIRAELIRKNVRKKNRNRRRNEAFLRQGEWFFVRVDRNFPELLILRNEPISRGRGKPHLCEELVRSGGEQVYLSARYRRGVTEAEYRDLIRNKPQLAHERWVVQRRNPEVYVRGRVRHSDHKTITLDGWHRVLMNTEHQAHAMRDVVFLD